MTNGWNAIGKVQFLRRVHCTSHDLGITALNTWDENGDDDDDDDYGDVGDGDGDGDGGDDDDDMMAIRRRYDDGW